MTADEDEVALWNREESPVLLLLKDKTETSASSKNLLKLCQYPSSHASWGIHSQVWDGGLATLSYILYSQLAFIREWRNTIEQEPFVLLDLGSGTGVVGIGVAAWMAPDDSSTTAENANFVGPHVIVTDIRDALPLLTENCILNQIQSRGSCEAMVLEWEEDVESTQIRLFLDKLSQKFPHIHRLLIIGSDVIYRPYLFRPLLSSIQQIFNYFSSSNTSHRMEVRCIMGAQSLRTHLNQFYDLAKGPDFGFKLEFLATVNVESPCLSTTADNAIDSTDGASTIHLPTFKDMNEGDISNTHVGKGIVHIFEMSL